MEIRGVSAAERVETMFPMTAYAFEATADAERRLPAYRERMRFHEHVTSLVAEEDGAVRACAAAYPMRQNVRGRVLDMAGVSSVASHPSYRRRGYVRELLTQLLGQMREQGCAVSTLYPFRASFYGRFGFVGLPKRRRVSFAPGGIPQVELPGAVELMPWSEGFDDYQAFLRKIQGQQHGFALFDEQRTEADREGNRWVALAKVDGQVEGALAYEIGGFGGELTGQDLLATGALGRALLLQFLGRHVDQVKTVLVSVAVDEVPELWGTDLEVLSEGRVGFPAQAAPMARVLDLAGLDGIGVGSGGVAVEVVDDHFLAGVHGLESDGGSLRVTKGGVPRAKLTAAGLSGLVYGVLDPVEVVTRGLGEVPAPAIGPLRALFPRSMPFLYAHF